MHKFHQLSTDEFVPISHENQYLFHRYDVISNFLGLYLQKDFKDILAKPVFNNYTIEWYSIYDHLVDVRDHADLAPSAYQQYFKFIDQVQLKIKELKYSRDVDDNDWAKILQSIFNQKDNVIYSNGENICIVWGWQFDNQSTFRPTLEQQQLHIPIEKVDIPTEVNPPSSAIPITEEEQDDDFQEEAPAPDLPEEEVYLEEMEAPFQEDYFVEDYMDNIPSEQPEEEGVGFLEYLRLFASKYWWLLLFLLLATLIVFTYKSTIYK